jgi:hypothetical protein
MAEDTVDTPLSVSDRDPKMSGEEVEGEAGVGHLTSSLSHPALFTWRSWRFVLPAAGWRNH